MPTSAQNAAVIALKAILAAGNPLSGRQLETRFGLTRAEASKVRQLAAAETGGDRTPATPGDGPDTRLPEGNPS